MAICIGCSFSCDWSEYYSFFVALTESGWEALGILLYNIYLVAGTVIFITAALPILISYVNTYAPKGKLSTTLSAYNFIGMSGSILAPYVTGFISDKAGSMQIGFYLAAVLLGVGLVIFGLFATDTKRAQA